MKTTVTAIIPTYNRAAYLGECLDALAVQTRPVDEIIVWDDGSTDETAEIVRRRNAVFENARPAGNATGPLQSGAGTIRYFRSGNGGKSRALNQALKCARGDYIWICDDDDLALPDATARLGGCLDSNLDLVAAAGSYRRFAIDPTSGARTEEGPGYWPDLSSGSVFRHLLEDMFTFQNATFVRRSAFEQAGPFREDLPRSIDYDMILRLAAIGPIAILNVPVFLQRQHGGDRGPAGRRHSATESAGIWQDNDRAIFDRFFDAIPLSSYEDMFEGADAALVRRAARLQRACVYARHGDWDAAITDMQDAAELLPRQRLNEIERSICRRAMAGKFATDAPVPQGLRRKLTVFARTSPAAADIAKELARGIVWRVKRGLQQKRPARAAEIACFAGLLWLSARRKARREPGPLTERRDLWFVDGPLMRQDAPMVSGQVQSEEPS